MSQIYKHNHYPSEATMDRVNEIVDVIETYLCNYKLGFYLVYQRRHLIRMDIYKLGSSSLIASYNFKINTLSLFKRRVLQGAISINDMVEENRGRGYTDEYKYI